MKKITLLAATLFAVATFGQSITNGTFDTDLSGWTEETPGSWVQDGNGKAFVDITAARNKELYQDVAVTTGDVIVLTFDISDSGKTTEGALELDANVGTGKVVTTGSTATFTRAGGVTGLKNGSHQVTFTITGDGNLRIGFSKGGNDKSFKLDNVAVVNSNLSATKYDANGNILPIVATYNLLGQQVSKETAPTGIYVDVYQNGYTEKVVVE